MPNPGVQTGSRVGSASINFADEKTTQAQLGFDPITLFSKVIDVFDAPISVREWGLTGVGTIYVQHSAGCFEGDVFEDLYIHGRPVTLTATNKLLVLPIDGRYRLRLENFPVDDVRVVAYRTNKWADFIDLFVPAAPTVNHLPLFDAFAVQLGYIDEQPDS